MTSTRGGGVPVDFRHHKTRRAALVKAKCAVCGEMIRTLTDNTLWTHLDGKEEKVCPGSRNPPCPIGS